MPILVEDETIVPRALFRRHQRGVSLERLRIAHLVAQHVPQMDVVFSEVYRSQ